MMRRRPPASVLRTPPVRPEGFLFETETRSFGSFEPERYLRSLQAHGLGECVSSHPHDVGAEEWGYSFTHLDGCDDGAGRTISAGYRSPPKTRADALSQVWEFLHRQYLRGRPHPWHSMNGHYPWHHYAAEAGFDILGSEIGENINNYQWHVAVNRGAARQYGRPWFMDFSAWHWDGISDWSTERVWGDYSGVDNGHSMSLLARSYLVAYLSGANSVRAEAGGRLSFLDEVDGEGHYRLTPYGQVGQWFYRFVKACPDVGVAYTPFALVLDFYHGMYPGFGERKAFHHFPYEPGDDLAWQLVDRFFPGGWEVQGKEEVGTLVNGPFGDSCDVLLQNVSRDVLDAYPCAILAGDLHLSPAEAEKFLAYAHGGGTLVVNSAYCSGFPNPIRDMAGPGRRDLPLGNGTVIVYGGDFDPSGLDTILREQYDRWMPFRLPVPVEHIVCVRDDALLLALVHNEGVSKAPHAPVVFDFSRTKEVVVEYTGGGEIVGLRDILSGAGLSVEAGGRRVTLPMEPGGMAVLEYTFR